MARKAYQFQINHDGILTDVEVVYRKNYADAIFSQITAVEVSTDKIVHGRPTAGYIGKYKNNPLHYAFLKEERVDGIVPCEQLTRTVLGEGHKSRKEATQALLEATIPQMEYMCSAPQWLEHSGWSHRRTGGREFRIIEREEADVNIQAELYLKAGGFKYGLVSNTPGNRTQYVARANDRALLETLMHSVCGVKGEFLDRKWFREQINAYALQGPNPLNIQPLKPLFFIWERRGFIDATQRDILVDLAATEPNRMLNTLRYILLGMMELDAKGFDAIVERHGGNMDNFASEDEVRISVLRRQCLADFQKTDTPDISALSARLLKRLKQMDNSWVGMMTFRKAIEGNRHPLIPRMFSGKEEKSISFEESAKQMLESHWSAHLKDCDGNIDLAIETIEFAGRSFRNELWMHEFWPMGQNNSDIDNWSDEQKEYFEASIEKLMDLFEVGGERLGMLLLKDAEELGEAIVADAKAQRAAQ